ncbi:MAG: glucose-1-phosphate cytidylyltransferase [Nitrospirae bacterium]|nr:MAG: glucose-1-phosphate cytidylyltransferase [Nitrospirota bacterium]
MKVVILCGGMGTRLPEETAVRPKPMVEIGKRPIIWHIMKTYAHHNFKEFVLCLGYKGEMIKQYFAAGVEDWSVTPVDTGEHALKGARLKRIQKYIDGDTFMVTYGDGVANVDIKALLAFHKKHGKLATVTGVRPRSAFGEIRFEKDGTVTKFIEKPQFSAETINGGFFVLSTKVFDYLSDNDSCDFEKGPLEKLVADGQLMVRVHDGGWACMDTYRDTLYLNELWDKGQAFWKVWK